METNFETRQKLGSLNGHIKKLNSMVEENNSRNLSTAAKLCNSLLFSAKLCDASQQTSYSNRDHKDTQFQDLLLQLTYGQGHSPISLIKRLIGNPLLSDLIASLRNSSYTKDNFAEIDFSKFGGFSQESPLNRKLQKVPSELMTPKSIGRKTELSLASRRDTNSDLDDDCFSVGR